MQFIGRTLASLVLVFAIGAAISSTLVYVSRPNWFEKSPEAVDHGNSNYTFEQLKSQIDVLGRSAQGLSKPWGDAIAEVEAREKVRDHRREKLFNPKTGRLAIARNGDPAQKGAAFFDQLKITDPVLKLTLIDVDKQGPAVIGPGGQPLRGTDTLLAQVNADAAEVVKLADEIAALRNKHDELADQIAGNPKKQIVGADERLAKQIEIRDQLHNELFFLAGFEVDWYAQRETVGRRREQLQRRLAVFGPR